MGRDLPARRPLMELEPRPTARPARLPARTGGLLRRWVGSPLGETLADLAPDLVRLASHAAQRAERERARGAPLAAPPTPRGGASGLTVSEVEIESTSPTIRRVVLRTASAWSLSPEALRSEPPRPSRRIARRSVRAAGIAGLALLGLAAARRAPLSLLGRSRD